MKIISQNLSIKSLAQKAESLGHTVGKGIAQNKFGSRTVMRAANTLSEKAKAFKSSLQSSDTHKLANKEKPRAYKNTPHPSKPSKHSKVVQITPEIEASLKSPVIF